MGISTVHALQCDAYDCDSTFVGTTVDTKTQVWESAKYNGWDRSLSPNGMVHVCNTCISEGFEFGTDPNE